MGQHELEALVLIDPVCGMEVNATSPHSCVRGGAMFFFCSEACRTRFMADPLNFVVISVPEHDAPAPTPDAVEKKVCEEPDHPVAAEQSTVESGGEVEQRLHRGGLRGLIESWLLARREGRQAARTSRELLFLYRKISANHPELDDRERYKLVVMARNNCDATTANVVLECAEESFSAWPVMRELTLCDVIHYLAVSEFIAQHDGEPWVRSDIRHMVISRIPHDLCLFRKK